MEATKPSTLTHTTNAFLTFLALYLTTLFSLDTWAAARASPYRAPGNNTFYRPAGAAQGSYQAGMHGRGNRGPGGGGDTGGRGGEVGRVDSRPAFKMGVTSGCGGCM